LPLVVAIEERIAIPSEVDKSHGFAGGHRPREHNVKAVSLFAGCGGFCEGVERAGFTIRPFAGREYRLRPVAVRADGGKQRGRASGPHLSRSESICEAIGTITPSCRFSTRPATVAG
jgi:hypothetical protein